MIENGWFGVAQLTSPELFYKPQNESLCVTRSRYFREVITQRGYTGDTKLNRQHNNALPSADFPAANF